MFDLVPTDGGLDPVNLRLYLALDGVSAHRDAGCIGTSYFGGGRRKFWIRYPGAIASPAPTTLSRRAHKSCWSNPRKLI